MWIILLSKLCRSDHLIVRIYCTHSRHSLRLALLTKRRTLDEYTTTLPSAGIYQRVMNYWNFRRLIEKVVSKTAMFLSIRWMMEVFKPGFGIHKRLILANGKRSKKAARGPSVALITSSICRMATNRSGSDQRPRRIELSAGLQSLPLHRSDSSIKT